MFVAAAPDIVSEFKKSSIVIEPSFKLPKVRVPDILTSTSEVQLPDERLAVPSVNVAPVTVPDKEMSVPETRPVEVIDVALIEPVEMLVGFVPISKIFADASSEYKRLSGIFRATSPLTRSLDVGSCPGVSFVFKTILVST